MSQSATPATRNEATTRLKPPKMNTSAKLPIGTAIRTSYERLRTVANGCGRGRNVERTHSQPPDPQSETGTLATHSGKHFTRTSDIPRLMANALRVHECQLWVNDNRGNPNTILGAARANAQQMLWHLWGEAPNDRTKPDTKTHSALDSCASNRTQKLNIPHTSILYILQTSDVSDVPDITLFEIVCFKTSM